LFAGAHIDQDGAAAHSVVGLVRLKPLQPLPRQGKHLVDGHVGRSR